MIDPASIKSRLCIRRAPSFLVSALALGMNFGSWAQVTTANDDVNTREIRIIRKAPVVHKDKPYVMGTPDSRGNRVNQHFEDNSGQVIRMIPAIPSGPSAPSPPARRRWYRAPYIGQDSEPKLHNPSSGSGSASNIVTDPGVANAQRFLDSYWKKIAPEHSRYGPTDSSGVVPFRGDFTIVTETLPAGRYAIVLAQDSTSRNDMKGRRAWVVVSHHGSARVADAQLSLPLSACNYRFRVFEQGRMSFRFKLGNDMSTTEGFVAFRVFEFLPYGYDHTYDRNNSAR